MGWQRKQDERERVGGGSPYGVVLVGANGDQICFLWKRGIIGWLSFQGERSHKCSFFLCFQSFSVYQRIGVMVLWSFFCVVCFLFLGESVLDFFYTNFLTNSHPFLWLMLPLSQPRFSNIYRPNILSFLSNCLVLNNLVSL